MTSVLARALRDLDSGGQLADVRAMPDHLRDALWRIESARLSDAESAGVLVCGIGGSAIGGDLAAGALGDRCTRPMITVRGYELPAWATPDWTVLCCSYSGNTEETVACLEAATALGARRIVATTGGELAAAARAGSVPVIGIPAALQPRAAVAYMFAVAAEAAAVAGVGPRIHTEIDAAAAQLEEARDRLEERSGQIAGSLRGSTPVIYGCDLTAPVAYRWKTQVNENAKLPAFSAALPEADHNELAGWAGAVGFSAVFLEDADQHPRERQRIELTAGLAAKTAVAVERVETEGTARSARILGAVLLGDLVSLQLAARRGIDPSAVEAIERFKDELGRPST
jgi:glucose/mannose-6-phosphate isomerase